jgi:hypothetical protein
MEDGGSGQGGSGQGEFHSLRRRRAAPLIRRGANHQEPEESESEDSLEFMPDMRIPRHLLYRWTLMIMLMITFSALLTKLE